MKVLFLTAEPPWPLDQGDKLRNYHLLKALAAKYEVTLVTFCPPGEENGPWREAVAPLCQAVYPVPLGRCQMLLNVLRLPHLPVTVAARVSFRMARLLRRLTSQKHYDIAFACQLRMVEYLQHSRALKRVLDMTDVVSRYWRQRSRFAESFSYRIWAWFEAKCLAFWEKKAARLADLVLLASPVDAAELKRMVPQAVVEILPNGVDLERFQPVAQSDRPLLFFYGHLRYPPNTDGILWFCREIFPVVKRSVPEAELWIAGKGLPDRVAKSLSPTGVRTLGYVPELRPCFEQASVVVAPLRFGAGTRLKILEALASGRAVVSTSLGCEGLETTPGIHLEVADSPAGFANAVIRLLCDSARRIFLAGNGRKLVEEKYSWEKTGEKLLKILNGITLK